MDHLSDRSSPGSQDPEQEILTPIRTSAARKGGHASSGSESARGSEIVMKSLHKEFDFVSSEPPELEIPMGEFRYEKAPLRTDSPSKSQTTQEEPRDAFCDICSAKDNPKSKVRLVENKIYGAFSQVVIPFRGKNLYPFQDALLRVRVQYGTDGVFACRCCDRQLNEIVRTDRKVDKKRIESFKAYIANRIRKNSPTENESNGTGTVHSKKCFLHNKTPPEHSCSSSTTNLSRPLRLHHVESWKREEWVPRFAKAAYIGTDVSQRIVDRADKREMRLCNLHYSRMRHILDEIEASQKSCSVCGRNSLRRNVGKVTRFPYENLKDNSDALCIIEDALTTFVGKDLQPKDIEYLCSSCRLIVCRRVCLRELAPRLEEYRLKTGDFDYGPTPRAVLRCIEFVTKCLNLDKKLYVRLRDVQDRYNHFIDLSDNEVEKQLRMKDVRTLQKYIQPSLAARNIFLQIGARKVGYYFCTLKTFEWLISDEKSARAENSTEFTSIHRKGDLEKLRNFFETKCSEIESGDWNLVDYIKAVPKRLWFNEINTFVSRSLKSRCRANAKLRGVPFEEEWPYNIDECPTDLHVLPNHEFSFVSGIFFTFERDVYRLPGNRKVRGPIMTALSITALTDATKALMSLFNRVGCLTSYQTVDSIRRKAVEKRLEDGPFGGATQSAFHSIAFDNINVRTTNSLDVHGNSYHGFDGFASQLVDANPSFDFQRFCAGRGVQDCKPRKVRGIGRSDFIRKIFPDAQDPDLTLYRWLTVGLAVTNKESIATEDHSRQQSFRNVLLNSLRGYSGGRAKVVYATISRQSAQDELTIIRDLLKIRNHFFGALKHSEAIVILAIVGDQPVFKLLFRLWYESYLEFLDGKSSDGEVVLCEWMVPLPGGFHIDKQGIIPTVTAFLAGSGLEELAEFTGLSEKHQKGIMKLAHYRKNRRFLCQAMAAVLLRLHDVVCGMDEELGSKILSLISRDFQRRQIIKLDRESQADRAERMQALAKLIPRGAQLKLADDVTPECIEIGQLICLKVEEQSQHSANMSFLAYTGLLRLLIPWSAYNILARRGQTEIMDKFWFSVGGFLHTTAKLPYQENLLWYALVKDAMPQIAYDVLFKERHIVMTISGNAATCIHLDEGMEMGAIRHTKMLNTCVAEILERSPAFTMLVGHVRDALERNLNPSRQRFADSEMGQQRNDLRIDGEKKTAVNVLMMYRLLTGAGWLDRNHRGSEYLMNVLSKKIDENGSSSFEPFVLTNPKIAHGLLNAEKRGREVAELHLSAKLGKVFGGLTENDYKKYFSGKALSTMWTLAFVIQTMKDADPSKRNADRGTKRKNLLSKLRRTRFTGEIG